MITVSRRLLLSAAAGALAAPLAPIRWSHAQETPTTLRIETRSIEVDRRPATVFGIRQPDGTVGLATEAGRRFRVRLENRIGEATLVHWHGLTPPWRQDGAAGVSQGLLGPGQAYDYDFALGRPGTFWMHAHHGLLEQRLLAAPLVVRDPAEAVADEQEVVVMLHDFTFRDPDEILAELRSGGGHAGHSAPDGLAAGSAAVDHEAMGHGSTGHAAADSAPAPESHGVAAVPMDLNDVRYDAFLANDRTLADPEVVQVAPGGRVRLRVINAAASTNFFLDLGALDGKLVAVDGNPVEPLRGRRFELAVAQRLDIRLDLPREPGAWPVLAQCEGTWTRTGIVLATPGAAIRHVASQSAAAAGAVSLALEHRLRAARPLAARSADRVHRMDLTGSMDGYTWSLNGRVHGEDEPLVVSAGERVEIAMRNPSMMAHPMHLHGHPFQVVEIDGHRFAGAVRDTVLVPPGASLTVAFDADNPGRWPFHCHHLYHMAAGMMTTVEYDGVG